MALYQIDNGKWISAQQDRTDYRIYYARAHKAGNVREVYGSLQYVAGATKQYATREDAEQGGPCVGACCGE